MQPEQGHHPDYNFIMNPEAPHKKRLFSGGDKKQRRLMMFIAIGTAIIVATLLFSVVFGGSKNSTDKLVKITQQQTEIIRVASLADKQAASTDTKNFASTIRLSLTSAQQETAALIAKQGQKLSAKQLAIGQNSATDTALTQAQQANRFDEVFAATMKTSLTAYQQELIAAYNGSKSKAEKALLQKLYNQTKILNPTQ